MALKTKKKTVDEISELLTPLKAGKGAGDSVKYDAIYDQIKETRREEDPRLPQGVWKTDIKQAIWEETTSLCKKALKEKSKDLQIVAWLIESWVIQDHIAGCLRGFKLLHQFVKKFWGSLYPLPEDGDLEFRASIFEWLNDKLPVRLQSVPVTHPEGKFQTELKNYTLAQWIDATHLDTLKKRGQVTGKAEGEVIKNFQTSLKETPDYFYENLIKDVDSIKSEIHDLDEFLKQEMKEHAPSFHRIVSTLDSIKYLGENTLRVRQDAPAEETPQPTQTLPEPETPKPEASAAASKSDVSIKGKEDAYQKLKEIADYLEKEDAHSLAPQLIRQAISWSKISMVELLQKLADSNLNIDQLTNLLEIKKTEEKKPE